MFFKDHQKLIDFLHRMNLERIFFRIIPNLVKFLSDFPSNFFNFLHSFSIQQYNKY